MDTLVTANTVKVAIVTGGSVRIGRAISKKLATDGFKVIVHTRAANENVAALIQEIRAAGGQAAMLEGDLADPLRLEQLIPEASEHFGRVTLLVNNASVFEPDDVCNLDRKQWDRHFAVNLTAPAFLIKDFALRCPDGQTGSVVNIIDQRVWRLNPQFVSYTLTKSALWTLTRTFAQSLAPRIRVNAVGPGPTISNQRQSDEDFAKQYEGTLLRQPVDPNDVAEAVLYLANAVNVTGQMIAVDAGQHLAWRTPDVDGVNE